MPNETYYDMQLNKLDRTARISIKLADGAFNETNWLALNEDCKQALLTFLGVRDATYTKGSGSENSDAYTRGSESEDSYNGWKNRETWTAFTWFSNNIATHNLDLSNGDDLRDWFETQQEYHINQGGFNQDLLQALFNIGSLWRVDWHAIAEALKEQTEGDT